MDLSGKNIVYVGGFGGIGFATCKQLVQKNIADLFILDLMEVESALIELYALSSTANIHFKQLDLRQKESIVDALKEVICKIEYIDILVNGSGIFDELDPDRTIAVNLVGLMHTTLAAIPYMDMTKRGRGGLIVNIASIAGLEGFAKGTAYAASKHGVIGFTKSIADACYHKRTGIAVMAICPGLTITAIIKNVVFESFKMNKDGSVVRKQTPEICATNLIKAIETGENNSIWILDLGKLEKVQLQKFWSPTYE